MTEPLTEPHRTLLEHCPDVAVVLHRPPSASPAELREELRRELRTWAMVHAHYFGPLVVDEAADRLAADGLPAAGHGPVMLTRSTVMAWLHMAARD